MRHRLLYTALITSFISSAAGAEFEKQVIADSSIELIIVAGIINSGDEQTFRKIAATSDRAVVLLDSEGGSVTAALEIGRAIRLRGFATAVAPEMLCASACALTWLAGTPRFGSDTSYIGFHASYDLTSGTPIESSVANALVGAYLNQLGLSQNAIIFVTSAPPEGIEWLSRAKAEQVGIEFTSLDASSVPADAEQTERPYDPLGTVTAFYNALSAADGDTAAAFVIPEKRGIGPFNEKSIHAFFGGLSVPLKLMSVSMETEKSVLASYRYTREGGKVCNGRASVDTVYNFGRTLISRFHALDGC